MSSTEYIEGQTLTQWMIDNPSPTSRRCAASSSRSRKGLRAFHRKEMLHQDLRPDNIMIDTTGTVKIIDFGSTRVAGVAEAAPAISSDILGTVQYTAPEYFLGEGGTPRSDLFSLGVIAYQMLTGRLPYGAQIAHARTRSDFNAAAYTSGRARRPRNSGLGRRHPGRRAPQSAERYDDFPSSCSTCATPTQVSRRRHRRR